MLGGIDINYKSSSRHLRLLHNNPSCPIERAAQAPSASGLFPLAARSKRPSALDCGMCPRARHQLAEAKLPQVRSRANGLPAKVPIGGDASLSNKLLIALSGGQALSRARSRKVERLVRPPYDASRQCTCAGGSPTCSASGGE